MDKYGAEAYDLVHGHQNDVALIVTDFERVHNSMLQVNTEASRATFKNNVSKSINGI